MPEEAWGEGEDSRPICLVGRAVPALQRFENSIDLGVGLRVRSAGVHNEIGARALVRIAHLPREHLLELLRRHARPLQHALALRIRGGAADDDAVDAALAAGL